MEYKLKPVIDGIYNHYKGGTYKVITLAKHSETQEDLVIYKSIEFGSFYARPLSMWFDDVRDHNDNPTKRFSYKDHQ